MTPFPLCNPYLLWLESYYYISFSCATHSVYLQNWNMLEHFSFLSGLFPYLLPMTNPLHYPDLERCKKLKEIWYPLREAESPFANWERPSVMEMLVEIAERIWLKYATLRKRIKYYGWSFEKAVSTPLINPYLKK